MSEERKKHISVLKNMLEWMEAASKVASKEERKEAVKYAISSLETDEAYQLEYEQPEFCANCIDRKALLAELDKRMKNFKGFVGSCNGITSGIYQFIQGMPSVLPKADKPTIIDWNNCHTSEQLESISTTKNDLAVEKTDMIDKSNFSQEQYKTDLQSAYDCGYEQAKNDLGVDYISKQEVVGLMMHIWGKNHSGDDAMQECIDAIRVMSSVTPQEPQSFKWCTDCKEYDQEKHCCHRYSKVIRDTVAEIEQEQEPNTGDIKRWE